MAPLSAYSGVLKLAFFRGQAAAPCHGGGADGAGVIPQ
jgi:hypothetical protein